MQLNIRSASIDDVESLVLLSKELGYEITPSEIESKIQKFNLSSVEKVLVAELDKVVGWMHISFVEPLESKPFVEIRGIVVAEEFRKKGIGFELIKKAEEWAREKSCSKIRVRTNITREETRRYYEKINFVSKKTQEVFEKSLDLE